MRGASAGADHEAAYQRLELGAPMRFLSGGPDAKVSVKVAVIGLGYVGSCIAATLADRGVHVVGVDTNSRLIEELVGGYCRFQEPDLADLLFGGMAAGRLHVTTDYAAVTEADVVLITVGTPVREDGSLADEQLRGACTELSRHIRQGQLLVLKSTVPPGTTRNFVLPLLERSGLTGGEHFGLAFTPERLAEGTAIRELRTFPIVAGGLDADSAEDAATFWKQTLGVEVIPLDSLEAAEIVKLADNWWIDLNIALANELAKFSALFDVDVLDVISAANTIPKGQGNVNILLPSVGVGGSCLTKDPWMVWNSARERGVEILTASVGREVNAGMPDYTAQLVVDELVKLGKDPADAKVAVVGLAFKNNTGDLRATPTVGAVTALAKAGAEVRIYDPLVDRAEAQELFDLTPATSLHEAVRDVDCIAILALHREFHDIDFGSLPVADSCVLLDGRAYYPREKIAELRSLGYVYRGIGR
jgi:dTDP-alpha-D-glucose dehydrogenase